MSMEEATNQYQSALKQGLREQREALANGTFPHPPILDELLEGVSIKSIRHIGEA